MGASAKFVLKKKWGLIFFAKLDTKGGSVLGISTAIKTALKVAPTGSSKWSINGKVKHYNWTKKIDFSMGPSVKFVLAIKDSISKKKMGVNFFSAKLDTKGGGGVRGLRVCGCKKSRSSFLNISLIKISPFLLLAPWKTYYYWWIMWFSTKADDGSAASECGTFTVRSHCA